MPRLRLAHLTKERCLRNDGAFHVAPRIHEGLFKPQTSDGAADIRSGLQKKYAVA